MSVLITGVTGFIGSNLARRLVADGYGVYGLVRHVSRNDINQLGAAAEKIRFVEGDLCEYHSVRSAIASTSPIAVIHLGALTPVRHSYEDPFPYAKINFEGTMNVAHAILETSPNTRMIAATTAEVYGWQPHEPISEGVKLNPSSPYGVSKAAADSYLQMAVKIYGLKATVIRANNTYGRAREKGFFVEYVVSSMLANKTVYVGTPEHIRDYMYVDDHVEAYMQAFEREEAIGQVFNVSPGNSCTNLALAEKIAALVEFSGTISRGSYPPGYPMRPANWDTDYIVLNSNLIRSTLGWKPHLTIDEGLLRVVEMFRKKELS